MPSRPRHIALYCALVLGLGLGITIPALTVSAQEALPAKPDLTQGQQSPNDLVGALHTAFGEHHARAVHTKGVMVEGTFTPDHGAVAYTSAPIFSGGPLQVKARFSLFAGVPDIPDTDNGAAPTGIAMRILAADGSSYDLASDQHDGFIVATSDEFATFLRAVGASGPGTPHPTPVEQFLAKHPESKHFVETLTSPASYATATFFGINSFKWTNAGGKASYVRYRYVPRAGEHYLKPAELKAQGPNYLQDDMVARVKKGPVIFDWYAQIAEPGDKIENPAIAWPGTRKLVKLGTFTFDHLPDDPTAEDKRFTVLVGQPHPGIEPADPMLVLRNKAYPLSFKDRQ
jgi:catalase